MTTASGKTASEWSKHGPVLLPCFAGMMLIGVYAYSLGVMIEPLEREYGWSRAEISTGPFIISMIALFGAPTAGWAVDRFGPRRIALIGVPFFCAMLACLSLATPNILSWWALWALLGISVMFVIPPVWAAVIAGLFVRNRGMALAIALCGTSLCAMTTPPLTHALVEHWGWRNGYVGLGLVYAVVVFPLTWFFLRGYRDSGIKTPVGTEPAQSIAPSMGASLRVGMRSPAFLKISAAVVVYSMALCALTTNAVPILMAQGLSLATAASVASLIGVGSLVGRLVGGVLLDRLDARKVAAVSVLIPIIAVGILLTSHSVNGALAASFVLGLSAGTEVDACAYLAARHFGMRAFGALFGAINGLTIFANGLAPLIANIIYDATQSYTIFLWAVIPACGAAAMLFLMLGPYPEHDDDDDAEVGRRVPSSGAKSCLRPIGRNPAKRPSEARQ